MKRKNPRPHVAESQQADAERLASREWRFAVEYVKHQGNATEAAIRVFNIGSRGGKQKSRQTAQAVGSEFLWKPMVQKYLVQIARAELNPHRAIQRVKEIMEDKAHPAQSLAAASLVIRIAGLLDQDEASVAPVVYLVAPTSPHEKAYSKTNETSDK